MAKTIVPVADLRREPKNLPNNFDHNDLRDSQLLLNETVEILESQGEWLRVAAVEQLRFTPERGWHPYEGWMHQTEIGEGTLSPTVSTFDREQIVEEAKQFLGVPYLWGGRSASGVDCSGLVNLLYRSQGIQIPRDAHDQFLFGKSTSTPQPGDPLYLTKDQRIDHVILKLDEGLFIEAPETGKNVRLLKLGRDFWEKDGRLHFHDRAHSYKGFYISFHTS